MSENQTEKKSVATHIKNTWRKHERKVLITATVASTAAAVVMRSGVAQHNAFLKEHGLYEKFYDLNVPTEA